MAIYVWVALASRQCPPTNTGETPVPPSLSEIPIIRHVNCETLASCIGSRMGQFVEKNGVGLVLVVTGFHIAHNPDTVRAPDVAFVKAARAPAPDTDGFIVGPPDLAVETASPGDRQTEVEAKTREWLAAGCRMVWVVDPETATVAVYRPDAAVRTLRLPEVLDGDEVFAGFRLPLAEIFGG